MNGWQQVRLSCLVGCLAVATTPQVCCGCSVGSGKYIGTCVLMGTGLQNAEIGLLHYRQFSRTINRLSPEQVTNLLIDELPSETAGSVQSLTTLFQCPLMATHLRSLAGLPGFLDMAARFLRPALRQSFPASKEERK